MGNAAWNRIYEDKGLQGKAIEHYEKFLDLWKDADPGITEIDDTSGEVCVPSIDITSPAMIA